MKTLAAYISIFLCFLLFFVYWLRPGWAAALTIFPAWIWLLFWLLALPLVKKRTFVIATCCWLLFGAFQVEEWKSVLRAALPVDKKEHSLRVTTINCSGSIAALRDAITDHPDIILVQESPARQEIEKLLAGKDGYEFIYGPDTSIIARGHLREATQAMFYNAGTAWIDNKQFFIISVRLRTSNPRIDLWKMDCWRSQFQLRQVQIKQMREIADQLPDDSILVVGGDFNVPQRDRIFSFFKDKLADTFSAGARGWCNTILVEYPMLRIDQIWTSSELSCYNAYVRVSPQTDHKLYTSLMNFTQP
ncbi:MAG: endonuclease/exonuclease/phosphatase family protein [Acidimicrobiales bacterium]